MFENQTPNPGTPKAEDIFATVDSGPVKPAFPTAQPPFDPATLVPTSNLDLPGESSNRSNKLIFVAGGLVLGLLVIAVGVWFSLAKMDAAKVNTQQPAPTEQVSSDQPDLPVVPQEPATKNNSELTTESNAVPSLPPAAATTSTVSGPTPAPIGVATPTPVSTLVADTDNDGLKDDEEARLGTNPVLADTDGDGLSDYDEVKLYNIDPKNPNTDGDTYDDGQEVKGGYNPNGPGKLIIKATSTTN